MQGKGCGSKLLQFLEKELQKKHSRHLSFNFQWDDWQIIHV
ncbi:hypothetical protein [Bacillus smithii]